jgi:hypothetical protein
MATSNTFYNGWKLNIGWGVYLNVGGTTNFKVTLHTSSYVPNVATQALYADLTNELSTANGYTNGGQGLTSPTWTLSGGQSKFSGGTNTVWTASGGSIVARYAVVRAVGTFNAITDPLIAYLLMDTTPADITVTNGNTLSIAWNASGIFVIN